VVFQPVRMHRALTPRLAVSGVLVVVVISALLALFVIFSANTAFHFGAWMCVNIPQGIVQVVARHFILLLSFIIAPILDVFLLIAIVWKLRKTHRNRARILPLREVVNAPSRNRDGTTVTLLWIAGLHCTLYLVCGLSGIVTMSIEAQQTTLIMLVMRTLMLLTSELLVVTNFANFFIYLARIKRFRDTLLCRRSAHP
jgi:hypothetical protein